MKHEYLWNEYINSIGSMQKYNTLLKWVVYCRAFPDGAGDQAFTEKVDAKLVELYQWLDDSGFYTSPASTQYHEAYKGGLCDHTLRVVNNIIALHNLDVFAGVDVASAVLVALVHDWCKIGSYTSYQKNVKDASGNWVKETAFKYTNDPVISLGHGVSSMYLASKWFSLSEEEALAIRWHMGAWRVVTTECNELQHANENYPLVHMLQFADQLAIVNYNSANNL